jgi:hypothetical protein
VDEDDTTKPLLPLLDTAFTGIYANFTYHTDRSILNLRIFIELSVLLNLSVKSSCSNFSALFEIQRFWAQDSTPLSHSVNTGNHRELLKLTNPFLCLFNPINITQQSIFYYSASRLSCKCFESLRAVRVFQCYIPLLMSAHSVSA